MPLNIYKRGYVWYNNLIVKKRRVQGSVIRKKKRGNGEKDAFSVISDDEWNPQAKIETNGGRKHEKHQ